MPSQTLDQKRIELLRTQLYGKNKDINKKSSTSSDSKNSSRLYSLPNQSASSNNPKSQSREDIHYLRGDLIKITILTTLALGTQLCLYFALQKHLLSLPFFK